jgi:hypothetical protein
LPIFFPTGLPMHSHRQMHSLLRRRRWVGAVVEVGIKCAGLGWPGDHEVCPPSVTAPSPPEHPSRPGPEWIQVCFSPCKP